MQFAYADPPYIGKARKHYKQEEVDHRLLIDKLVTYDGWALSCSSPSLRKLLAMCPEDVRVSAWVKPFCIWKQNVNPTYAWEPIIWKSARKRSRGQLTIRDWLSCNITLKKGLVGAKPEAFCYWLFDLLNLQPDDTLDDLYPGTGIVTACWEKRRVS